jgi:hypothetical protein
MEDKDFNIASHSIDACPKGSCIGPVNRIEVIRLLLLLCMDIDGGEES